MSNDNKQLDEAAEIVYRKINSYANPSEMRGIEKRWIIEKIKEGIVEWQSQQKETKPTGLRWVKGNMQKPIGKDKQKLSVKYKSSPDLLVCIKGNWYWYEHNIENTTFPVSESSWSVIEWLSEEETKPVEEDIFEIDMLAAQLEDTLHGEEGKLITQLRGMLSKLNYSKLTPKPVSEEGENECATCGQHINQCMCQNYS